MGGRTVSWQTEIRRVAESAGVERACELVVFSGAGISQEHPTHAPSGWGLMTAALANFFLPGTLDEMGDTYDAIRRVTGQPEAVFYGRPRLEAVLDVVNEVYGPEGLAHLTPYFAGRQSNRVHAMLAAHLSQGGPQITANFDRFIEHLALPESPQINHFHGQIESPSDTLPFGARLGAIEHGFEAAERSRFLEPLVDDRTRCVAFIGYSFSDYFDATPAIVSAIQSGALDGKTLVWFKYDRERSEPVIVPPDPDDLRGVIGTALARGIVVVTVVGRSGDALFELLAAVGCELDEGWTTEVVCDGSEVARLPPYPLEDGQEKTATLLLLSRFGMLGRIPSKRLDLTADDIPPAMRTEYYWKKGHYEEARTSALAALQPERPFDQIRMLLLHARFDWIEGRLGSAGRQVLAAIRELDRESDAPASLRIEALERYGRIAVHMRRTPDARLALLPGLRRRLPDYERRAELLLASRDAELTAMSHLQDALRSFQVEVLGRRSRIVDSETATRRADLMERFNQTESIDSYVGYLRGNANLGIWELPATDGNWQEQMSKLYDAVGNEADNSRLILFEPPGSSLQPLKPWRAARALDVSTYHRLRMLARHWMKRLPRMARQLIKKGRL